MKINKLQSKSTMALGGVFLLCLVAGVAAGTYLKQQTSDTSAASANITVLNNDQIITQDQGTSQIIRTSTLNIKDTQATLGYTLSARLSQNSIPNATVKIGSTTSTTCPVASPCTITTNSTPVAILETSGTSQNPNPATTTAGDTTQWTVTITLPANTPLGSYIVDVEYSEDPITPLPAMQDFTRSQCAALPLGETIQLRDNRDDKVYRIRKMADSRCWMIDNLAYDINSAPPQGKPAYAISPEYDDTPSGTPDLTLTNTKPQYAQNISLYSIPNNGNPTASYLYNWCATMGDISTNCAATIDYAAGQPATPQVGICPGLSDASGFRLPIIGDIPTPSTPGNGLNQATAAASTTNEFAKLDIYLGGTGIDRATANTYPNFTTNNATSPQLFWSGTLSGYYYANVGSRPSFHGVVGFWWSSTASSGAYGHILYLERNNAFVDPINGLTKGSGAAIRCLL